MHADELYSLYVNECSNDCIICDKNFCEQEFLFAML